MTYRRRLVTARVLIPATSEPASGSVMPMQRISLPWIAGAAHSCFCSSVPKARIGGIAMSVWTATPIARPPQWAWAISSASTRLGVVVAALAAVLLGLVEAEEAELAHPLEHPVGERRLLPLLGVRLELLDHEAADRLPQLLVLVGEDEVLALGREVGLEDVGGGHAGAPPGIGASRTLAAVGAKVNSRASYFSLGWDVAMDTDIGRQLTRVGLPPMPTTRSATTSPTGRGHDRARPARDPQRALRRAARRPDRRARVRPRRRCRALPGADLDPREGVLQRRQPGRLRRRRGAGPQALRHRALPARVPAARRARQAVDLRRQRPRAGRRARAGAGLRPDRRQGGRAVRHAGDQRRAVPVHDHGADLPQRRAQEDRRADAARRADLGRRGRADRDRQPGRRRRASSTRRSPTGRAGWRASRRR